MATAYYRKFSRTISTIMVPTLEQEIACGYPETPDQVLETPLRAIEGPTIIGNVKSEKPNSVIVPLLTLDQCDLVGENAHIFETTEQF